MNRLDLPKIFSRRFCFYSEDHCRHLSRVFLCLETIQRDFEELYWGHSRILKLPQYGITSFVLYSSYLGHDPVNRAAIA